MTPFMLLIQAASLAVLRYRFVQTTVEALPLHADAVDGHLERMR